MQLRLYVGRFAGLSKGVHEAKIREWCGSQVVGAGPIQVIGLDVVVTKVMGAAAIRQYRDNPVLVTLRFSRPQNSSPSNSQRSGMIRPLTDL